MRLIFMGTPGFAVPALEALAASRHTVAAVVTNPDRPKGRGRRLSAPPIKQAAEALGLDVLQPASPKDPDLAARLASFRPDLFAVVAFSILPRRLLEVPRLGSVNLHPSLLPAYRGAAPIAWAVINGESRSGLTSFLLNRRMDAGDILLQEPFDIGPDETAGEVEARICPLGAELLVRSIDGLEDGSLTPRPQGDDGVSRAPKLDKEDGRIDWRRPAAELFNLIRGTNPMPGAFAVWQDAPFKVHRATVESGEGSPGTLLEADDRLGPLVAAGTDALRLTEVQPAGKARMDGAAFVRGRRPQAGQRFGS